MVRTGAPEPDIGSIEAFKSVLRRAKAISYSKGPSAGNDIANRAIDGEDGLAFHFGGEAQPPHQLSHVKPGEAEIGMQQIIENQPVKGAYLVGPLPVELINYVMYSAGFASAAPRGPGQAFVQFLASPEAVRIIRAKGMEPA